jgi:hypothetical protein
MHHAIADCTQERPKVMHTLSLPNSFGYLFDNGGFEPKNRSISLGQNSLVTAVHAETHPRYYALLKAFKAETGCPVLINTSSNVRGEPIVCTPEELLYG